jgi:hypothetical protein
MAQSGYTPITLYNSTTPSATPAAGNLATGELALNAADGKLFYKNSVSNTVLPLAGLSGYSGFSGISGYSGFSGISGYSGSGISGYSGFSGISGYSGFSGISGYSGASGISGYSGATGASGISGYSGATGTSGFSGYSGSGISGYSGATGTGTSGYSGYSGSSSSTSVPNTWTATQTFNGSSSTLAAVLLDAAETVNVVAGAPSATTNFYVNSGAVQFYTSNATVNWTLNIAFSSGTSLNSAMSTGQSVTIAMLSTQGFTAYYNSAVTIDGTSVTPKWQGGTAPTAGDASSTDVYTYTVIKTASATYTVLASLTQFK